MYRGTTCAARSYPVEERAGTVARTGQLKLSAKLPASSITGSVGPAECYWARFQARQHGLHRLDTRIYLLPQTQSRPSDVCIGCIIGKNPGSARPVQTVVGRKGSARGDLSTGRRRVPIALDRDSFLPTVRSIVHRAHQRAGLAPAPSAYISVLNLFYLCEHRLLLAKKSLQHSGVRCACSREKAHFSWAWYAWGGADCTLDPLKRRFTGLDADDHFFFSTSSGRVCAKRPGIADKARHTQGMRAEPVITHLATLLGRG